GQPPRLICTGRSKVAYLETPPIVAREDACLGPRRCILCGQQQEVKSPRGTDAWSWLKVICAPFGLARAYMQQLVYKRVVTAQEGRAKACLNLCSLNEPIQRRARRLLADKTDLDRVTATRVEN